jgi:hypothetical protein
LHRIGWHSHWAGSGASGGVRAAVLVVGLDGRHTGASAFFLVEPARFFLAISDATIGSREETDTSCSEDCCSRERLTRSRIRSQREYAIVKVGLGSLWPD